MTAHDPGDESTAADEPVASAAPPEGVAPSAADLQDRLLRLQAELENFRKKEAGVKVELKLLRRDLRQEVESMENRLKWANIAGMPFLVTIGGIGLAVFKRKRTAAR